MDYLSLFLCQSEMVGTRLQMCQIGQKYIFILGGLMNESFPKPTWTHGRKAENSFLHSSLYWGTYFIYLFILISYLCSSYLRALRNSGQHIGCVSPPVPLVRYFWLRYSGCKTPREFCGKVRIWGRAFLFSINLYPTWAKRGLLVEMQVAFS